MCPSFNLGCPADPRLQPSSPYTVVRRKNQVGKFLLGVYSKLSAIVNGALHISQFPAQVVRFQRIYRSAPSEMLLREFHEETHLTFGLRSSIFEH